MRIETERLLLRPVEAADTDWIGRHIFGDPMVAGMLAHDTRDPAQALAAAAKWTGSMHGATPMWAGGMGLFAVIRRDLGGKLAGVAGFYMERGGDYRWSGEYFYALARPHHRQGIMREVADLLGPRLRAMPDLGVIYAAYWDGINDGSGKVLRRTGLSEVRRKPVTEEYPAARCRAIFAYDLWRLRTAAPGDRAVTCLHAARRAAAFVADAVIGEAEARAAMTDAAGGWPEEAEAMFRRFIDTPGSPHLEIRGPGVTGVPVNRLG